MNVALPPPSHVLNVIAPWPKELTGRQSAAVTFCPSMVGPDESCVDPGLVKEDKERGSLGVSVMARTNTKRSVSVSGCSDKRAHIRCRVSKGIYCPSS